MRAADVLLDLGPEAAALSGEIARARMRIRAAEGHVLGFLTDPPSEPLDPVQSAEVVATECEHLASLVDRRRAAGAPLPPGNCAAVPFASFSAPRAGDGPDANRSPAPTPS
jgi:hypothetical protein